MKNDSRKVAALDTSKCDTEHFLENTRVVLIHESRSKSIVFSSDALCGFSCSLRRFMCASNDCLTFGCFLFCF